MKPWLLAPVAALMLLAPAAALAQSGITLSIASPDRATAFRGTCTIAEGTGERTETYDQTTPLEVVFEGARGLRCRLESAGTIEVTATAPGGSVSRARTSGGTVSLDLGG
jgi:hypothetical protein